VKLVGAEQLVCRSVEDLKNVLRRSCQDKRLDVVAFLPQGDVRLQVAYRGCGAVVRLRVVFREDAPFGGTWWTTSEHLVPGASSGDGNECVVLTAINGIFELRERFDRLLAEKSLAHAAVAAGP
jgi:hypothetical protein